MRTGDDHDHLRGVLRAEAGRHQPDRAAMLDRVTRARAEPGRGAMARIATGLMRPAGAAAAVAAVLAVGVAGAQIIRSGDTGRDTPAAVSPPSPQPTSSQPTSPQPSDSARGPFLTATATLDPHSFANWAQSNLVLRTTETITALDVTIRIARTGGAADTGHWTSIPSRMVTTSVEKGADAYVYRFVLKKGGTLAPGGYTFAAQYNHATGDRDVSKDGYRATAGASGDDVKVSGTFG